MPLSSAEFKTGMGLGAQPDPTNNNGAYSRSGSIAENTKFDGASAENEKYDLSESTSGNNHSIGQTGWGS